MDERDELQQIRIVFKTLEVEDRIERQHHHDEECAAAIDHATHVRLIQFEEGRSAWRRFRVDVSRAGDSSRDRTAPFRAADTRRSMEAFPKRARQRR